MWAALEPVLIVFMVIVAPIWLVLHYRSKKERAPGPVTPVTAPVDSNVDDLWQTARRMEERIRTLERILDVDAPNWRGKS